MTDKPDLTRIREQFPILSEQVHDQPLVYLDNAATSQKPQAVIDALTHFYTHDNANVYRSVHTLAGRATASYEQSREVLQRFIGAAYPEEVIFTSGTTDSINRVADGFASQIVGPGDEILISYLEHHSNLVPWQMVAKRSGATLRYFELTAAGELDAADISEKINDRTKIVALSHVSNVLGTINPVKDVIKQARHVGAYTVIDGAQAVPHLPVNVQKLGADFYTFSGHKMYGPTGIGVLYGRRELLERMAPTVFGGEMIARVEENTSTWNVLPYKLEAGTPNIAGAVGLAAAAEFLETIGMDRVSRAENALHAYALSALSSVPGLEIYGPGDASRRASVIAFNVAGIHPHDLATALDLSGIAIRAGHHCTQPLMKKLEQAATARISFGLYNEKEEIDHLVEALLEVIAFFKE